MFDKLLHAFLPIHSPERLTEVQSPLIKEAEAGLKILPQGLLEDLSKEGALAKLKRIATIFEKAFEHAGIERFINAQSLDTLLTEQASMNRSIVKNLLNSILKTKINDHSISFILRGSYGQALNKLIRLFIDQEVLKLAQMASNDFERHLFEGRAISKDHQFIEQILDLIASKFELSRDQLKANLDEALDLDQMVDLNHLYSATEKTFLNTHRIS